MFPNRYPLSAKMGPELRINLTHPDHSMLQAPLSKEAGGYGSCMRPDGTPVFKDKIDPTYLRMFELIQVGEQCLKKYPRIEMLGVDAIATNCTVRCSNSGGYMITSHSPNAITFIDNNGEIITQITHITHPQCAHLQPNGNVFSSETGGAKMFNAEGHMIWKYSNPPNTENPVAQVLGPDRFLIGREGPCQLVEINSKGEELKVIQLSSTSKARHGQFRFCCKTPEGTYFVPSPTETP